MATFDFVPCADEPPEDATSISLRVPNPDHAKERAAFEKVLARNPFATAPFHLTLSPQLTASPDDLVDAGELCVDRGSLTLVVGYPFAGQYAVTVAAPLPAGFTRADLFRAIVRVHEAMYDEPALGGAIHRISDLALEGVYVATMPDGGARAWISLGS